MKMQLDLSTMNNDNHHGRALRTKMRHVTQRRDDNIKYHPYPKRRYEWIKEESFASPIESEDAGLKGVVSSPYIAQHLSSYIATCSMYPIV